MPYLKNCKIDYYHIGENNSNDNFFNNFRTVTRRSFEPFLFKTKHVLVSGKNEILFINLIHNLGYNKENI